MKVRDDSDGRRLLHHFLTSAGQKAKLAVSNGATSVTWTFDRSEVDTDYGVLATPTWATTVRVSARATTSLTLSFGSAAGASDTVDIIVFRE